MPIYEYYCDNCCKNIEVLQKMTDPLMTKCPKCQGSGIKKLISAAGFRLKGKGWYETDFKSVKQKNLVGNLEQKNTKVNSPVESSVTKAPKEKDNKTKDTS